LLSIEQENEAADKMKKTEEKAYGKRTIGDVSGR